MECEHAEPVTIPGKKTRKRRTPAMPKEGVVLPEGAPMGPGLPQVVFGQCSRCRGHLTPDHKCPGTMVGPVLEGTIEPKEITPELLDKICYHIATEDDGAKATAERFGTTIGKLMYFLTKKGNEELMARFQMAKITQLERIGEEIIDMADTASNENFKFLKIRIDARQWVLSRLLPKYSDQKNVKVNHSVETYEERLRRLRGK